MKMSCLKYANTPQMTGATMLLALSGWMDGGLVSTGTVKHLMRGRDLLKVADILPGGFYLENFPGSMDIAAIFRPNVKYEGGLVTAFETIENVFYADPRENMVFFIGKEPNNNWDEFSDCIYDVAGKLGVKRLIFIGSFGGSVPHTRQPRIFGSVSHRSMLEQLDHYALIPSDYEGPGSFASQLLWMAPRHNVEMFSLAVEIPGYLKGANPASIEAVIKRLSRMLKFGVDLDQLRNASTDWEHKVSREISKDKELAQTVRELEEQYDKELIETTELE